MPAYIQSPFKPSPALLLAGTPSYLWGSFNDRTGPTIGQVMLSKTNGTTTATIQFKILSGNIPVNGSKITVVGSANSANFNVTNATISNVTQVNVVDDGTYTLTYPIAATATPTTFTADGAQLSIPQPEVGEVLANGASFPVAVSFNTATLNQGKTLSAVVSFPTVPTTATVTLQSADIDLDSEYADIATVASVTGSVVSGGQISVGTLDARFYRFNTTNVTGSGLIVAKVSA